MHFVAKAYRLWFAIEYDPVYSHLQSNIKKCIIHLTCLIWHPLVTTCFLKKAVKRECYQNCFVLGCVTQCSQSAAHSCEQFLQVQQIGFITLEPLRHA